MKLKMFSISILCIVMALPTFSQTMNFSDWDEDNDQKIERYEFVDIFTDNYLEEWGITDEVASVEPEPFYLATYNMIDTDDDERIDEDDWVIARQYIYDDYLYDDYAFYDADNDGFVEYAEYYDTMYDSGVFEEWDVDNDGLLDKYELAYAIFDNWDLNDNFVLDKSEYNLLSAYYVGI